jgi:hypothetical protein
VVQADPAEVARLQALHQMPRGQHNRRPWLKNQEANLNIAGEEADDHAGKPQL